MTAALTLSDAEVSVVAQSLEDQLRHVTKMRGSAERYLAEGDESHDWTRAASMYEKRLAAIDSLVAKLPAWVRPFLAAVR